jgi:hypothetical protein
MGSLLQGGRKPATLALSLLVVLGALWLWLDLPGGVLGHQNASGRASSASSVSSVDWQLRTVRRGLEEIREPSNRNLPPLAITNRPPEPMPPAMREKVFETLGPGNRLELDFDRARLIRTRIGIGIWVVEGRGVTCAFRDGIGSSICQTSIQARRHGLLLESYKVGKGPAASPTHFTAFGVSPNWVRFVVVEIAHRRHEIPIVNHAYALRAEQPIEVRRLAR